MTSRLTRLLLVTLLFTVTGCLPYSCRREVSRALYPADSLSRAVAEAVPMDTLRLAWRTGASEEVPLGYPRTLAFGDDGRLFVADVEGDRIVVLTGQGALADVWEPASFDVPYLAGWRGDTLVVFNPAARALDFVVDGGVARTVDLAVEPPGEQALVYAAATDSALYFKAVGEELGGYVARLDERGGVAERIDLPAPFWRYAGLMRAWGDTLVSLSGFRPVIDVLRPGADAGARLDTVALVGFDSPMLSRSRLFALGEVDEPPLLSPAAAVSGDLLFVINLRTGWLRIDVFDRSGRLCHRLVDAEPTYRPEFFPQDLAVRRRADGRYEIAVAFREPEPHVDLYRVSLPDRRS